MRKYIIGVISLCLASAVLSGCGNTETEAGTNDTVAEEESVYENDQANEDTYTGNDELTPVQPVFDESEVKKSVVPADNYFEGPYISSFDTSSNAVVVEISQKNKKYKLFEVDIAEDEAFSRIVSTDLYDSTMIMQMNLSGDTRYYLRVRGFDGSNYSDFSQIYTVKTLSVDVETVSLDEKQLDLVIGEQFTLQATVMPDNATDKSIVWSSGNEDVVTVTQDGEITAVGLGNAAVIATASGEVKAACAVHVGKNGESSQTEILVLDKDTLNGNAVFGRYDTPDNRYGEIEENVSFDGKYNLNSFDVGNQLLGNYYHFGGLYKKVTVDDIPFAYTWTIDSGFDFHGNDCIIVSDDHNTQTLGFVGAGAYGKLYLLSLADEYVWDSVTKEWKLGENDITASVVISYKDGSTESSTVNFGNMMKKDENTPYYDAYIPSTIVAEIDRGYFAAGQAPYMYAVSVPCNPEKQISSVTLSVDNQDEQRRITIAVFAVSGQIGSSAPASVDADKTEVTDITEYGFCISWENDENALGYYVSIFEDEACSSPCYVSFGNEKIYLTQATLYTNSVGFSNEEYNPGETYYVKIAAFNKNGSSKATVIPIETTGTYPPEIRVTPKTSELSIGETVQLKSYFPTTSYYTYSEVVWSVSNPDVIRVVDGKVTAIGEGTATVRVALKQYPQIYAECTVTVAPYGENIIGYDDGILLDSDISLLFDNTFYTEMDYAAIKITSDQIDVGAALDEFYFYVDETTDKVEYKIYVLEKGQTPINKTPVTSATVATASAGWTTFKLNETVMLSEGEEIWIAVNANCIPRADNYNENGALAKIDGHWVNLCDIGIDGTFMIRAHFTES